MRSDQRIPDLSWSVNDWFPVVRIDCWTQNGSEWQVSGRLVAGDHLDPGVLASCFSATLLVHSGTKPKRRNDQGGMKEKLLLRERFVTKCLHARTQALSHVAKLKRSVV